MREQIKTKYFNPLLLLFFLMLVSGVLLAQGRGNLEDEDWEDVETFPYEIAGEFDKVKVSVKEESKMGNTYFTLYEYELNENMEPKKLRVYDGESGSYLADYFYSYAPGEVVSIVKKRNGIVQYTWKMKFGEMEEEALYVDDKPAYIWIYESQGIEGRTISKLKPNGKSIYTWYYDYDDQGRVQRAYRVNGRKITQLLAHVYKDDERSEKIYHFDRKALRSLEIGLSLDRDSIIRMDPKEVASMYYRPLPVTTYKYTEEAKIAAHSLKTQAGRTVFNYQYMYNQDDQLIQKSSVSMSGIPKNDSYYYNEDGTLKSKIAKFTFADENVERTHIYSYDSAGRLEKVQSTTNLSSVDALTLYFQYRD